MQVLEDHRSISLTATTALCAIFAYPNVVWDFFQGRFDTLQMKP